MYWVTCKKYTANKNSSVRKIKQNRLIILSNCTICGKKKSTFIKNHEIRNFNTSNDQFQMNKTSNLKHLYRNDLDKHCFAHNTTYSHSKDLAKRTISDKIFGDRAYQIARNRGQDGYQRALARALWSAGFLRRKQNWE